MSRQALRWGALGCALAATAVGAHTGFAATGAPASGPPDGKARTVSMTLTVERFSVRGGRAVAHGSAYKRVQTRDGMVHAAKRRVTFAVATAANCRVLTLRLADLQLNLLGLHLNTSTVNLRISGDRDQTLGAIFCRLSTGLRLSRRVVAARTARSLNRRLKDRPMRFMAFRASVTPQTQTAEAAQAPPPAQPPAPAPATNAPGASCKVLRLVLGPLDLDLMGLVVNLYGATRQAPVVVELTADPNGGALGSLFCRLASSNVTLNP